MISVVFCLEKLMLHQRMYQGSSQMSGFAVICISYTLGKVFNLSEFFKDMLMRAFRKVMWVLKKIQNFRKFEFNQSKPYLKFFKAILKICNGKIRSTNFEFWRIRSIFTRTETTLTHSRLFMFSRLMFKTI